MSSVNFGQPTDLGIVLNALKTQVSGGVTPIIDPTRVFVSLEQTAELERDPIDDNWLMIAPVRFSADQKIIMGTGNDFMAQDGVISIVMWNRYEVDYTHDDILAITDTSLGIIKAWKPILKAFQLFAPIDSNTGWCILEEPMRCIQWNLKPRSNKSPWLRIESTWECKYVENLT